MTSSAKPLDLAPLVPKCFLGATIALLVSRPLIGDFDPARQTITCGAGPLTHQLLTFLLLFAWGCWRVKARRPVSFGGPIFAVALLILGMMIASTLAYSDYRHASWCLVWEVASIAATVWIVHQWRDTPGAGLAFLSVLVALAASVSAQAIYQQLAGPLEWPDLEATRASTQEHLVGDFALAVPVARLPTPSGVVRGCFESSETLFAFLLPFLPVVLYLGHVGWWHQKTARSRGRLLIVLLVGVAFLAAGWWVVASVLADRYPFADRTWELVPPDSNIGPGNFSRHTEPPTPSPDGPFIGGLTLNTWGFSGPLIFILGIGLLYRLAFTRPKMPELPPVSDSASLQNVLLSGGLVGSVIGFALHTGNIPAEAPPSAMLNLGVVAGVRSLVFFATLALLQGLSLNRRSLLRAFTGGILVVLLFGIVSEKVLTPVVLHPFLVLVAVAFSLREGPVVGSPRQAVWKPLLVCFGGMALVIAQLIQSLQPGLATTSGVRDARQASRLLPELMHDVDLGTGARKLQAMQKMQQFLRANILTPLRGACKTDSTNSILLIETAHWLRLEWNYCMRLGDDKRAAAVTLEMLSLHEFAVKLDPRNLVALTEQLESLLYVFDESKTLRKERAVLIEKNLGQIQEHFPQEEFAAREKYLQVLLRIYERPVAKPVEEDRRFIRDQLEAEAVRVFSLDEREKKNGGGFRDKTREDWVRKLQIAILDPKPELKDFLDRGKKD